MTLREAIILEARRWLGTPFHHRARVLGAGVDCVNLLAAVYESVGLVRNVVLPKYPRDWMLHRADDRVLEGLRRIAMPIPTHLLPLPGDVATFRVGRAVAHAGIVVQWPRIIHADADRGAVVEEDAERDPRLASRYVASLSVVDRCWVPIQEAS